MGAENRILKARKKWSEDERARADILTGNKPTDKIARIMGRSPKAIQHHYADSGISPFTGDGRITIAELSRRTNIPFQTLVEWANMGKLAGVHKVGAYWRVDLSVLDSIQPLWDGKKYLPQRLENLGIEPGTRLTNCINCGMENPRHANYFCSKKCRGEDMSIFTEQKLTGEDKPEHHFPPHLRLQFQDFLASVDALKRLDLNHAAKSLLIYKPPPKMGSAELIKELLRLKRYVLPDAYVYRTVYGTAPENERIKKLDKWMYDFRGELVDPSGVLRSPKLGYGLGAQIIIPRIELMVLRMLWQKEKVPVSIDTLAKSVSEISRTGRHEALTEAIMNLRRFFSDSEYQIVTIPPAGKRTIGGSSYRFQKRLSCA